MQSIELEALFNIGRFFVMVATMNFHGRRKKNYFFVLITSMKVNINFENSIIFFTARPISVAKKTVLKKIYFVFVFKIDL